MDQPRFTGRVCPRQEGGTLRLYFELDRNQKRRHTILERFFPWESLTSEQQDQVLGSAAWATVIKARGLSLREPDRRYYDS